MTSVRSRRALLRRALCAAALPVLLSSCAAAVRESAPPLEAGRYAFDGQGRGTHQFRSRNEVFTVNVTGTVDIHDTGEVEVFSSHGTCVDPRPRRTASSLSVSCRGLTLTMSRLGGSARVPVSQIREEQGPCEEYATDAAGRPTSRCLRYLWVERRRTVMIAVPVSITPMSDQQEQ
jgi:hypothetical protein